MTAVIPASRYEVYADDDDVIGTTIARTYPSGWPIVGNTAGIVAFDEFQVGQFLAWCLTHADDVQRLRDGDRP